LGEQTLQEACATRFLAAFHQARRRGEVLHAGETVELVHGIAHHEAEACAKARDSVSQVAGMGLVGLGGVEERAFEVLAQVIIRGAEREVDRKGRVPRGIAQALSPPRAVGLIGHLLAELGPVVLAGGLLDMRQACGACAHQVCTAPEQGTGGPQLGGSDRGLWAQAAAAQGGKRVRIACVVCGLAPVEGVPGEGVTPPEGKALVRPQSGAPRPGEEAFDGHDQPLTRGGHGLEERFRSGWPVAVQDDCTVVAQDADRHRAGLPVDAAVKWVRLGVAAPEIL
jgi:hypothetical protein